MEIINFIGKGKLSGNDVEIKFKTTADKMIVNQEDRMNPEIKITPLIDKNENSYVQISTLEKGENMEIKSSSEVKDYSHLKKVTFTLYHIMSYDDKEKLVSALTNNGYVVGTSKVSDTPYSAGTKGWKIDIYE